MKRVAAGGCALAVFLGILICFVLSFVEAGSAFGAVELRASQTAMLDWFQSTVGVEAKEVRLSLSDDWSVQISGQASGQLSGAVASPLALPLSPSFRVQDLRLAWSPSRSIEISLGRWERNWSTLDRFWGMGILQPRYRVEPFSPGSDGLTGLHARVKNGRWSVDLFASGLALPDQNPGLVLEKGVFRSSSPWASAPQSRYNWGGASQSIQYAIEADISQILFRPTVAARIAMGDQDEDDESDGGFASAVMSYGAMPFLTMAARVAQPLDPSEATAVTLLPQAAQHWVVGAEWGWKFKNGSVRLGVLQETPLPSPASADWLRAGVVQDLAQLLSVSLMTDWKLPGASRPWFRTGVLFNDGGLAEDLGALAPAGGSLFEPRTMYRTAVLFEGGVLLPAYDVFKLGLETRAIVDLGWRGIFASADLVWKPGKKFGVKLGADVVGSNNHDADVLPPGSAQRAQDLFLRHQANDRVRGELTYAF